MKMEISPKVAKFINKLQDPHEQHSIINDFSVDADLSENEKQLILKGRKDYEKGNFISLDEFLNE